MKKLLSLVLAIALILSVASLTAFAANTGSLSASGTARPGETFTVTFTARGAVGSYSGAFSYDASQVTLVSTANAGGSHWSSFSSNGNNVYAQRDSGTTDVVSFNATFKVNAGVATGTAIKIGFSGTIATSVSAEDSFSVSTTMTVAAPLSNDATLSALTVSNATLSPAFNANTTSYSCGTVKFDVAKLGVTATANAQGANVAISGANLGVGKNTVSIVVTAPSGDKKTYTISVEREQDPNYKPSNDTTLSGIELSAGTLSPAFNVENREYVVYLPFETKNITIKGTAASELAKGVEGVENAELKVGTNELAIKVTAEDDSVGEYKIYVVRMDEFGGINTVGVPASLIDVEPEEDGNTPAQTTKNQGLSLPIVIAIGVGGLLIGFAIGALIFGLKRREPKDPDDYDDYDDYDDGVELEDNNSVVPMEFEDIQSDSGTDTEKDVVQDVTKVEEKNVIKDVYTDPLVEEYLSGSEEELPPPAPIVTPQETPVADTEVKVTFADLNPGARPAPVPTPAPVVEPAPAPEVPKEEERPHVRYIDYNEYIESLNEE